MQTSHIAYLSRLSLFDLPPLQDSIVDYLEYQVRPVTSFSSDSPCKFYLPCSKSEYLMLNECELYVKIKVIPTFKAGITPSKESISTHLVPENNLFHSLFKKCNLLLNNVVVSDESTNYSYKSILEAILGYTKNAQDTDLSTCMYGQLAERKSFIDNNVASDGKSATFTVGGRLNFDLSYQNKAIIGGTDVMLELIPNSPQFYFRLESGITDLKVEFEDMVWYAHKFKVSTELEQAHQLALHKAPARYSYTMNKVRMVTVNAGLSSASLDNLFLGNLPRRLFFCFVGESSINGDFKADPYKFEDANLSRLAVFINGKQYPNTALRPSFKSDDKLYPHNSGSSVAREYRCLLKSLNENHCAGKLNYTYSNWMANPIYGFNFNPDLSNGAGSGSHVCKSKTGQLSINVDFAKPLTKSITLVILAEFDTLLTIDEFGSVIVA